MHVVNVVIVKMQASKDSHNDKSFSKVKFSFTQSMLNHNMIKFAQQHKMTEANSCEVISIYCLFADLGGQSMHLPYSQG
jgi:hypothetical protein